MSFKSLHKKKVVSRVSDLHDRPPPAVLIAGWFQGKNSGSGSRLSAEPITGGRETAEDPDNEQQHRAEVSELPHQLDNIPIRSDNSANQVLELSTLPPQGLDGRMTLKEARAEMKHLQRNVKEGLKVVQKAYTDRDATRRMYLEKQSQLLQAERRTDDAVFKMMTQMEHDLLDKLNEAMTTVVACRERVWREREARLERRIGQLELDVRQQQAQHATALGALQLQHARELVDRDTQHEQNQKALCDAKQHEIGQFIDSTEAETRVLKNKVRELTADIISQTDDFRPATDEALRSKLLDLRNRIKNLAVPINLSLYPDSLVGKGGGSSSNTEKLLPPDLDPSGFMRRHGPRELQYLLRGLVWGVLVEAFFGEPFGFGFLGHGDGHQRLLEIHRVWLAFYTGSQNQNASRSSSTDELAVYCHDYNANKLRSAIFQSFLPAVFPDKAMRQQDQKKAKAAGSQAGGYPQQTSPTRSQQQQQQHAGGLPPLPRKQPRTPSHYPGAHISPPSTTLPPPPSHSGVGELHHQHCQEVMAALTALLDRITDNATRPGALDSVSAIVNQAAELGLECGVQRVQLQLLTARAGDTVTVGPEYQDCLGSDKAQGQERQVNLLVSPGLIRIGDGRGEMTTRKALVPCEFFPRSY